MVATQLTLTQLAVALGISERQAARLAREGLPSTPVGQRGKRYDLAECKTWLRGTYQCRSNQPKPAALKSVSASTIKEFTVACRQVQVRVKPSESTQS